MGRLSLRIFRGSSGLAKLAADWDDLARRVPGASFAHQWGWQRAYLDALADVPEAVCFAAWYDGSKAVAILGLVPVRRRIFGVEFAAVRLPRHDHVPHGDLLVAPGYERLIDLEWVLGELRRAGPTRPDVMVLEPVLGTSCAARVLAARAPRFYYAEPRALCDAIETMPYPDFLARLSKNFRGALRKARNKLAQLDGVSFASVRTPEGLGPAFEQFLAVEASGWKGESGTAIAHCPPLRAFYGGLVEHLGATGQIEINLLYHRDRAIAAQFAIACGEALYVLKIGYDESYNREAPGNMLLEKVLEKYQTDPAVKYIDLVSGSAWHESWSPVRRERMAVYVFSPSAKGLFGFAGVHARQRARPAYKSLKQRLQEVVAR